MTFILRERRKSSVVTAALCILAGVVLVTYPGDAVRWMCMALGAVLLLTGCWFLVSYFRGRGLLSAFQFDLFLGIVLAVLGLWLLLRPEGVVAMLQYVFGAFILLHGVSDLQAAVKIKRAGYGGWAPAMAVSALTALLAVVILVNPFASFAALVVLIGVVLIYSGVVELYLVFRLSRLFSAAQDAAETAEPGPIEAQFTEAQEPKNPGAPV